MSTTLNSNYSQKFKDLQYKSPELLNPVNHVLVLIDFEGQMAFPVENTTMLELRNNLGAVAYFSKIFEVPTIITTIGEQMFAGPVMPEIREFYPDARIYDRTSQNTWEDDAARKAIIATGKKKLVMAGLWTDVCLAFPVISALKAGYEVYFIADASGTVSVQAHELAVQRMIQAGAIPIGTVSYISELIRDWGRKDNTDREFAALVHHGVIRFNRMGIGVDYADYMVSSYPFFKGFGKK